MLGLHNGMYDHLQLQYGLVEIYQPHTYTIIIYSYNMDWWKYTNLTLTLQLSTAFNMDWWKYTNLTLTL